MIVRLSQEVLWIPRVEHMWHIQMRPLQLWTVETHTKERNLFYWSDCFFIKFLYSAYSVRSSRIIQTYWFKKIKILYIFMLPMGNWTTHIYIHWLIIITDGLWAFPHPTLFGSVIWKPLIKKFIHYSDHFISFSYLALIIRSWKGSSWLLF